MQHLLVVQIREQKVPAERSEIEELQSPLTINATIRLSN